VFSTLTRLKGGLSANPSMRRFRNDYTRGKGRKRGPRRDHRRRKGRGHALLSGEHRYIAERTKTKKKKKKTVDESLVHQRISANQPRCSPLRTRRKGERGGNRGTLLEGGNTD